MAVGKKVSIYMTEESDRLCRDIVEANDVSTSDAIRAAIYDAAIRSYVKVSISEGAYLCLAAGRFDLLRKVKMENGFMIVVMDEIAYHNPDGTDGEFKQAKDKLFEYLGKA